MILSKRLKACADMVRDGARLLDVGCDHGYVPVYLVKEGKVPSAVACDINEAPLSSCRRLVADYDLEDKIKCVLSDGFDSLDLSEADDILIAGLGGNLIEDILNRSDLEELIDKHLIFCPATHPEKVKGWLYANTFEINKDFIVSDGDQYYNIIDAYYRGSLKEFSRTDLYLGKIEDFSEKEYFNRLIKYLKSKEKGGEDFSDIISDIEEKIK